MCDGTFIPLKCTMSTHHESPFQRNLLKKIMAIYGPKLIYLRTKSSGKNIKPWLVFFSPFHLFLRTRAVETEWVLFCQMALSNIFKWQSWMRNIAWVTTITLCTFPLLSPKIFRSEAFEALLRKLSDSFGRRDSMRLSGSASWKQRPEETGDGSKIAWVVPSQNGIYGQLWDIMGIYWVFIHIYSIYI